MTQTWIVDGNNVVGTRPDGWWRDRPAAAARLVGAVSGRRWPEADRVLVIFDGPARRDSMTEAAGIEVLYSGRGCSADDSIVGRVSSLRRHGSESLVVTSDRALADRVRALGAEVMASRRFLDLLEDGTDGRR